MLNSHRNQSKLELDDNQALFKGEAVQLPLDLYIPPDALEVWLDEFEGPLDLLLHLIRKNNFDILDIPIADIATQYMEYVTYLKENRFELATEYLVMAAWLAEIKSRILLPRPPVNDDEEELDPRLELIQRLQIYTQYKQAAENLNNLPRVNREIFMPDPQLPEFEHQVTPPAVELSSLINALQDLLKRTKLIKTHTVTREKISINERMSHIVKRLSQVEHLSFDALFNIEEGRYGVTISFLAILELTRNQLITLSQEKAYGEILISSYQQDV